MKLSRKTIGFGIAVVIGIALVLIHVPEVGEKQDTYTLNSGELTGTNAIGQTIVASKNNLDGIGVIIATYSGRNNTHPVTLHVRESVSAGSDIRTVSALPNTFGDNQFYNFTFKPIANSAGKTYFFLIDSPDSTHGNAIAVDLNAKDTYPNGTAYIIHTSSTTPLSDSLIQRSGKQNIDAAFQVLYSVPLGTYVYHSISNAVHTFINTWNDNRHEYALWAGAIAPSILCVVLCIVLFRFKKLPKPWITLLTLAIVAAVIRIFYALSLPFTDDEGNYLYDAWSLLHGHFAGGDGYVKAPLVILWIALWEGILGHTALAGRISSIIVGAGLVYPIFLLVRSLWSTRAALVSSALWACMGTAAVSTIYVHTQPVAMFFGASGIALLAYALREKQAKMQWLIGAGAVIGLAVASRKSMLALGLTVILLLVSLSKNWNARLKNTLYVGIGFLGVLVLFLIYAHTVYGTEGIIEALGINSADDGISSIDPDQVEQVREYSLKGMTPFFRESLPIILFSLLGVGFYLQDAIASAWKKLHPIIARASWIIPLGIFWWAWDFFSQYEGAKFMKYGIPTLWWLMGIMLVIAIFLPAYAKASADKATGLKWVRGVLGLVWLGSMMFFYDKWIKFHANYISEFIPPLVIIAGIGVEAFVTRALVIKQRVATFGILTAFSIIAVWAASISSYVTYNFEHTGTFDQKAAYEAATWMQQNIPAGTHVFTGASLIPYLAGYQTALNISHPRWYAYEFTRTNPERIQTFLPTATSMVQAFHDSNWFILDAQTKFSYLNEYDPITNDLKANWKSVKGISNGSNTIVFYQRLKPYSGQ